MPPSPERGAGFRGWLASPTGLAALGAALLWAALPPLDLWPLAWIAPVPWLILIARPELIDRRTYWKIWGVGQVFWMAAIHWIRLPYPALYLGWVAMSAVLACYLPLFIGLSRVAVHRLRVPLIVTAPVVFAGVELARAHILTGFLMGSIAHTQYRWPAVVQIADLGGEYTVDFLIVLVAACLARMLPADGRRVSLWPLLPMGAVLAAAVTYGQMRLVTRQLPPGMRVALIQGSIDVEVKEEPNRKVEIHRQYGGLTAEAMAPTDPATRPQVFLWPETTYRNPLVTFESGARVPPWWGKSQTEFTAELPGLARDSHDRLAELALGFKSPAIIGLETLHFAADRAHVFNSAVNLAADGRILDRYDKQHPVMFGEYTPLAQYFPWLHELTPVGGDLDCGSEPKSFQVGRLRMSPSICYESVLPHLIRGQVAQLIARGAEPDVLVNLTNDGWFYGSSELDMHLVCGVFRAIECRKPLLIAANTGFSAWIDGNGQILRCGPRRQTGVVIADVQPDGRRSLYVIIGDLPAGLCLAFAGLCAAVALLRRRAGGRQG